MSSKAPRGATPPNPAELPSAAELEARARELFTRWGLGETLGHVEVHWNHRLRTTAGRARLRTLTIELNPNLLARVPERIDEVLAHEAAHLATAFVHKGAAHHGPEWRARMAEAGYPPDPRRPATHDFPIDGL